MSSARIRLFVALELPAVAREAVTGWSTAQADRLPGARPLAAESLHVTLCFLGGQDVGEVDAIAGACRVAGSRPRAELALALGRPLWLPRRRPRTLAIEVTDEGGALAGLQSALAATLVAGGWYRAEQRAFLAHVSAARIARPGLNRPPELPAPPALCFAGDAVSLYRSVTSPAGARYERLATVMLAG